MSIACRLLKNETKNRSIIQLNPTLGLKQVNPVKKKGTIRPQTNLLCFSQFWTKPKTQRRV